MHNEEYAEYLESEYCDNQQKNRFDFVSKLFSSKKGPKGLVVFRKPKNVPPNRYQRVKHRSSRPGEHVFLVRDRGVEYEEYRREECPETVECGDIGQPHYDVVFLDSSPVETYPDTIQRDKKGLPTVKEYDQEAEGKLLDEIQKNRPYLEVVTVEDRGTDPWETTTTEDRGTDPCEEVVPAVTTEDKGTDPCEQQTVKTEDKGTDAICPVECKQSCEKQKKQLSRDLQDKEKNIKSSLEEGVKLRADVELIKNHLAKADKICLPAGIVKQLNYKQETPADFIQLSRTCLMELAKLLVTSQKQSENELLTLKNEILTVKKENTEKESKIRSLERKLEAQLMTVTQETNDIKKQQSKIMKLQDSIETARKQMKDAEKNFKETIEKLETELGCLQKENAQLSSALDDKDRLTLQLETSIERLQMSLDNTKQQLKEVHNSYKSKFTKLESEHTTKMATLCENQATTNKQLSQALKHSNNYVNQLQEAKKENAELVADNKSIREKFKMKEEELMKSQDRCAGAERKLTREIQEVMSLKSQVERLEKLKEEELLSVDGDIWCQIMYQQDQWILDDLRASLSDKECNLENLRSQGDCALRDFEKAQNELQQRRQQFNELKDVFLDFEKKRDIVVREQRDFYNKMMLLSRRTIPKDKFFKNLIEECQLKSSRIEELELQLSDTNKVIEENNKISEAQLKAMQAEMKFTAEKLYEFENQISRKDQQLQDIIRVFEQEKKNKMTAQEAMNTYKILLEDSKKENIGLRNKLNFLEDLEKNRANAVTAEELAQETQRRQETEHKLKSLEKELLEVKCFLQASESKLSLEPEHHSKEVEKLKKTIRALTEDKKYLERILKESQKSKELLQKDKEELSKKMGHAVRVMVEARATQEALEMKLDKRMHIIKELQKSQIDTDDRLDVLKDVVRDMKDTINDLDQEKISLQHKLSNHMHCKAERAMHQELQLLQRDKAVTEEQNSREKEMLLSRLKDTEETLKEQHKHLRAFQEQLDSLNAQLRDTKEQLVSERHAHTQQLLAVQAEKKRHELYIQEVEGRLAYEAMLRTNNLDSVVTAPHFDSSDSYELPDRDHNKHHYFRK